MRTKLSLSLIIYLSGLSGIALVAQNKYPIDQIPQILVENSDIVVRESREQFSITAKDKAIHQVYEAYTILNPNGRRYAIKAVFYDKLIKVSKLKAAVYNKDGALIKKWKSSDFDDQSAITGYSLYEDNRIKIADLTQNNYPFTVELEYELAYNYLFYIPSYYPIWKDRISVQHAAYTLSAPVALRPRYKGKNISVDPVVGQEKDGTEKVIWEFENLPAMEKEKHSPSTRATYPHILAAPSTFEYAGYSGNMNTWDDFGTWINTLNKGRDELSEETKAEVKSLISGYETIEEKTAALYDFLQNKTRYVSIQLGIGGFQPFEAKVVDQVGYGDCKALSNYMVALLKEAGIQSNYTLIRAGRGEDEIDPDFPSPQFNHVIVAVPNAADTIWLECTSQRNPYGYLGSFTGNRYALAITGDGAKIVKTPAVAEEKNFQVRKAQVYLNENGSARADVVTQYSGLECEKDNLNFLHEEQYDDQRLWLEKTIQIPTFKIEKFKFNIETGNPPLITIALDLKLDRLASVSGQRLFVTPNLMNKFSLVYTGNENRKSDIIISESYNHIDTIVFSVPENLYPEIFPKNVHLSNQFGEYQVDFLFEAGKVTYMRKLKFNAGKFPADSYGELNQFNKEISKADNMKLVFLNKT